MDNRTIAFLLLLAPVLAACGSSTDSGADTAPPPSSPSPSATAVTGTTATAPASSTLSASDPCSAVSAADVSAAYGGHAAAGAADATLPGRCTWAVSGSSFGDGRVSLFFASVQSRSAFDSAQAGLPGVVSVSGVGDAAFYQPLTKALEVAVGETVFTTQGTFSQASAAQLQAADKALAHAALGS